MTKYYVCLNKAVLWEGDDYEAGRAVAAMYGAEIFTSADVQLTVRPNRRKQTLDTAVTERRQLALLVVLNIALIALAVYL